MRYEILLVSVLLLAGGVWALLLRAACRSGCDGGTKPPHPLPNARPARRVDACQDLIDKLKLID